jgi:hypothetical protein
MPRGAKQVYCHVSGGTHAAPAADEVQRVILVRAAAQVSALAAVKTAYGAEQVHCDVCVLRGFRVAQSGFTCWQWQPLWK